MSLCSHLTQIGELSSEYLKQKKKKNKRLYKNECVKCFTTKGLSLLLLLEEEEDDDDDSVTMESLCPKHLYNYNNRREVVVVVVVVDLDERLMKCLKCSFHRELNEKENLLLNNYSTSNNNNNNNNNKKEEDGMNPEFFKLTCHHFENLEKKEWTHSLSDDSDSQLKCHNCDLKENLWICLSCGFIGCGRRQFDGSGGNSHALDHYMDFNNKEHSVCLKVFTLLNESPDLYCYQCDDLVVLPFGNQLEQMVGVQRLLEIVKEMGMIEKKMEQLEMEKSIDFFSSLLESGGDGGGGEYAEPLFGEFLTGLYNIGNSCYLSSILQVLFSRRMVQLYCNAAAAAAAEEEEEEEEESPERNVMVRLIDLMENHLGNCRESSQCDECQLVKMYYGMVSGEYSRKEEEKEEEEKEDVKMVDTTDGPTTTTTTTTTTFSALNQPEKSHNPFQKGIPATMLKDLIGKRHQEFGGGRQQDAYEFYEFMLGYIDSVLFKDKKGAYEDLFKVDLVQKLQCSDCLRVSYSREQGSISLSMPLNASSLKESVESGLFSKDGELLNGFKCNDCQSSSLSSSLGVKKRVFIGNAPEVLCMVGQRFMFEGGQVQKRNDGVEVDLEELDFSKFYDDGEMKQGEQQMSESSTENSEDLQELMGMGFSKMRCLVALKKTKSKEEAMEYILQHLDEPEPEPEPQQESATSSNKKRSFREEDVLMVMEMGFTKYQAEQALEKAKGSMEQAVELLFQGGIPAEEIMKQTGDKEKSVPGSYELFAIVAHKGKSPHSGHYVAYIKDPVLQQWVLFNDEKVVSIKDIKRNEGAQQGYLYFWARK